MRQRHNGRRLLGSAAHCVAALAAATGCASDEGESPGGSAGSGGQSGVPADVTGMNWSHGIGHDDWHTRSNPAEKTLTKETVAGLRPKFELGDGFVAGSVAAADGIIYFGDDRGKVRAADAKSGVVKWEEDAVNGITGSVTVADGKVFAAGSSMLFAFDAETGARLWDTDVSSYPGTQLFSSPHWVDGTVVIGVASRSPNTPTQNFRGEIIGVNATDGAVRWRFDVTKFQGTDYAVGVSVWSSPVIDRELKLLYIGTGQSYDVPVTPLSDACVALNYETGEYAWHAQFTANDVFTFAGLSDPTQRPPEGEAVFNDSDVGAAPNLFMAGDVAAVGVGDKAGNYYAMNRATGEPLWTAAVSSKEVGGTTPWGGVMTVAAVHDGVIYATGNTWTVLNLLRFDFAAQDNSTHVVAIDAETGRLLWRVNHPAASVGGLTWAGGVVYQSTADGNLRALDDADGSVLWTTNLPAGIAAGPTVYDGMIYTGTGFSLMGGIGGTVSGGVHAFGL